ncbi:MAG TPA: diguanylate cyclase [bacterium]|nr:diguanylate cyclase [bacterium]
MADLTRLTRLPEFIVDCINVGVMAVDRNMNVVLWNRFMEVHSGKSAEEIQGKNLFDCFPDLPRKWLERKIRSVFLLKNFAFTSWQQRPYLFRFSHHEPVTSGVDAMRQDCTFLPVKNEQGEVEYACLTIVDTTDTCIYQTRLHEALISVEKLSREDSLTGLLNRGSLESELASEIKRARRYGSPLSLILFDLDHFKRVNDKFGHQAGDAVLRHMARQTRRIMRDTDIIGRYGGEEFLVILPDGMDGAMGAAERLRLGIAGSAASHQNISIPVTVSAGISTLQAETRDHEQLIREVDLALYEAKRKGRNRVVRFIPDLLGAEDGGSHRDKSLI